MSYKITNEQIEWFKENYPVLGRKECASNLNTSIGFCGILAKRYNIKVSKQRKSSIARENAYKQFELIRKLRSENAKKITIDTPEKAYSLGFLWGDGYLSKANPKTELYYISMEILEEDMQQIKPFLSSLGNWTGYVRKRNKKHTFCAILCDPVLGLFLKNNDYDKKSLVDPNKILSIIPEDLQHYWWRGYSDADGCFYVRKNKRWGAFTIVGNIKQEWRSLINLMDILKINYKNQTKINKNSQCSIVTIQNREGIISFGNYLYQDNNKICLNRKYEKFSRFNK
jgi:hypothetical protein